MYNGVLLINKPKGYTSHDVVAKARGILKTKKIGHAGTLDPMATGVLPLFLGTGTKAIDRLPNHDKAYTATLKLGIETDTQDITGEIIKTSPVNVTLEDFKSVMNSFMGLQKQIPPMYSAVQVDGKRLYKLARQGIEVERPAREITVYCIELLEYNLDESAYTINVSCSKGTYIRTIVHDIGEKLGCGGTLTDLQRTVSNGFKIEDCITMEQLQQAAENSTVENYLTDVESLFSGVKKLILKPELEKHFLNGVKLWLTQLDVEADDRDLAIYSEEGVFLGVARPSSEKKQLIDAKFFIR